jgi:oligopeptide transport system substrate-binding protein
MMFSRWIAASAAFVILLWILSGFGEKVTRVEHGNQHQVLHMANGAEPEDLDPQITTGVQEDNIIRALIEGLVSEHPEDLSPVPGMAERWDISDDGRVYTFHLRTNALWSSGDPVTSHDFVRAYERALSPSFFNQYAYMLYYVTNAEAFHKGEIKEFNRVGFDPIDDHTLRIELVNPTPYFLSLLNHHSWFPVHIPTIEKHGQVFERGNRWTRPENFVGNGPFRMAEWKVNHVIVVTNNPTYWDAGRVSLKAIQFYPIDSLDAEERAFRSGQVHVTDKIPLTKIRQYKQQRPELLRLAPYLGSYFYIFNTTKPPFDDVRVRKALSMALDREAITANITRGGELPAFHLVPPDTAGYTTRIGVEEDLETARRLLAEAGYPGGRGFPATELLYNTLESHKMIAEAIQQMWKVNLNIDVTLRNEEWKVYLNSTTQGNFQVSRRGWIADYVDPNAFLDLWITGGGNNDAKWSNPEYDRLLTLASQTIDQEQRYEFLQQAEAILMDELPICPIYFYVSSYLLHPAVKNWHATILDHQPYKYVRLDPEASPHLTNQEP